MLYRILLSCLFALSCFGVEHVYLKTPEISKEGVSGTNAGIRPFRKSGVRLEAEQIGSKLIVHNYGYGGSGLTLAFGGAAEVLDLLDECIPHSNTVAILGAGVIGLATAYDLLEQGYQVHIYADAFSPHLTSNVAAGIWTPLLYPKELSQEKKELHLRMEKVSEQRLLGSVGASPEFEGVGMITAYSFTAKGLQESDLAKQREAIVAHFDNGVVKEGRRAKLIGIDGAIFMNDLFCKVVQRGARVKECHFKSLADVLKLKERVIINCTSMGSVDLFNDHEFIPIRGQLVYFKPQCGIDYLYAYHIENGSDSLNHYFVALYPWSDRLILGGILEKDQEDLTIVPGVIDRMIENAQEALAGKL